jgi:hypothetical protein
MEKIFDYKYATIHEIILDRWLELNLIEINFQKFIQNFSKFNPIKNSIFIGEILSGPDNDQIKNNANA